MTLQNTFEKQVVQIAALGVWQIVTGKPMRHQLTPVPDGRWQSKDGLFVTLREQGRVRGSMGMFEASTELAETLFEVGQTAATHDQRFPPVKPEEMPSLSIEVILLSQINKLTDPGQIQIGKTGIIVTRGESQAVLLPQSAIDNKWTPEQFLEACCEKAKLSHKAWKDPNTLVEYFECQTIDGGKLLDVISEYV